MNDDVIREKMTALARTFPAMRYALGVEPWPGTPEQLGELLRADIETYGKIVRSAGLPRQ